MAVQDILQPQGERPEWDKEYYENSEAPPSDNPHVLYKCYGPALSAWVCWLLGYEKVTTTTYYQFLES